MDRISRLFGRKNDSEDPEEEDLDRMHGDPLELGEELIEPFGLKFSLDTGENFLFSSLPITIGRSPENDLAIDHDTVSSVHALVYYDEVVKDVCISDQESLNGIYIDDLPTRKNILHDGVKVSLGEVDIRFRDTGYIHNQ